MILKHLLAVSVLASVLSACGDGEPIHDVQYYLDHSDERTAKLAECRNNLGEKALAANCINAGEAARQGMFQGDGMPKIR